MTALFGTYVRPVGEELLLRCDAWRMGECGTAGTAVLVCDPQTAHKAALNNSVMAFEHDCLNGFPSRQPMMLLRPGEPVQSSQPAAVPEAILWSRIAGSHNAIKEPLVHH